MPYELARQIESRLDSMLSLLESGQFSTPKLAQRLGVSIPTVSRCIDALRQRGFQIEPVRQGKHWHYRIVRVKVAVPRKKKHSKAQSAITLTPDLAASET